MRTKNFLKHLILGALLLTTGKLISQATVTGNLAGATSNFLGWDPTSPANDFPLRVKHEGNWPIEWYTDNIPRMKLFETGSGSLPLRFGPPVSVPRDGFVGISGTPGFLAPGGYGPFTRLHLADLDPNTSAG